jgi:hypothetical protein
MYVPIAVNWFESTEARESEPLNHDRYDEDQQTTGYLRMSPARCARGCGTMPQTDCGSNQRCDQKDVPSFHGPSLTIDFSDAASQLAGNVTVSLTNLAARSTALNILANGVLAEHGSQLAL